MLQPKGFKEIKKMKSLIILILLITNVRAFASSVSDTYKCYDRGESYELRVAYDSGSYIAKIIEYDNATKKKDAYDSSTRAFIHLESYSLYLDKKRQVVRNHTLNEKITVKIIRKENSVTFEVDDNRVDRKFKIASKTFDLSQCQSNIFKENRLDDDLDAFIKLWEKPLTSFKLYFGM